jgi:hypothetical protein
VVKEEELANFHIRTFRLYKMHNNVREDFPCVIEHNRKLLSQLF